MVPPLGLQQLLAWASRPMLASRFGITLTYWPPRHFRAAKCNGVPFTRQEPGLTGTPLGPALSTIYLAAAVRDNGAGRVISTEPNAPKVAQARANIAEAGLADWVTILEGDALETFADLPGPVEFVLLDGWKNLYLPVLHQLEPRLVPGALVLADDSISLAAQMADYLAYVRDPGHGYVSVEFPDGDGLEISCRA